MAVNAQAGNQMAPEYANAGLWGGIDARPRKQWPAILLGGIAWESEETMSAWESAGCRASFYYGFLLRQTRES